MNSLATSFPPEQLEEITLGGTNALATGADSQLNEQESPQNFDEGIGQPGADGKSAYEIAVEHGFVGTEEEWLESLQGEPGSGGEPSPDEAEIVATENLPALSFVTAGGQVANSSNTSHFGRVVGITMEAILSGFVATLFVEGEVTDLSWSWTANQKLFLNGTTLSTVPATTGFSQLVGITRNSSTVFIRLNAPVLL